MKHLKQHILEKLKVSTKDTVTMTNEEFFNLLMEYTNTTNVYALVLSKIHKPTGEQKPLYSEDTTQFLTVVQPYIGRYKLILIDASDINANKFKQRIEINVNKDGDQIVSFTSEDWLLCIIKYMQDVINSK